MFKHEINTILRKCKRNHYFLTEKETIPDTIRKNSANIKYHQECPDCIRLGHDGKEIQPWMCCDFEFPKLTLTTKCITISSVHMFNARHYATDRIIEYLDHPIVKFLVNNKFEFNKKLSTMHPLVYGRGKGEYIAFMPGEERSKSSKMVVISDDAAIVEGLTDLVKKLHAQFQKENPPAAAPTLEPKHKDFIGGNLQIGQWVGFMSCGYLGYGQITKFSEKMITINKTTHVFPFAVFSLDEKQLKKHLEK